MRKLLITALLSMCVLIGCGNTEDSTGSGSVTSSSTQNSAEDVPENIKMIGKFEKAEYEKFNSYASDNGLGGTLIYIEGTVLNQTKIGNSKQPLISIVIEQKDSNRWCASVPSKSKIKGIKNKKVRVFGVYQGFSDVVNLPTITLVTENTTEQSKIRIDVKKSGKYKTIWKFSDYIKEETTKKKKKQKKQKSTKSEQTTNSDAYEKGKELGEKLNEKLESIDWDENYEKAEEAGRKAAEWLNKFFE